jgi:hypothetical protein
MYPCLRPQDSLCTLVCVRVQDSVCFRLAATPSYVCIVHVFLFPGPCFQVLVSHRMNLIWQD